MAITKNCVFYIGYFIFGLIDKVIMKKILKNINENDYVLVLSVLILIMFISEIFISTIFLIFNCICACCKKKNEETEQKKNSINNRNIYLIPIENNDDNKCFNWKIPFISIFDICSFIPLIFNDKNLHNLKLEHFLNAILLISTALFTVFYLKYPIYKHHIFGIAFIVFGYFIIDLFEIYDLFTKYFSYLVGILILLQIPYSCKEIFEKELIEIAFFKIIILLLYEGIFGSILILLFIIMFKNLSIIKDYFIDWIKNKDIFLIIIFIISCGLFNIFRLKINQIYGPIHKYIGNIFIFLFVWIVDLIYFKEDEKCIICVIVCYILIIGCGIIFTEIFNFNCCCNCCSDNQNQLADRANENIRDNNFYEEE